jgi:hypothetical protein
MSVFHINYRIEDGVVHQGLGKLGVMAHTCSPSTGETEAGRS